MTTKKTKILNSDNESAKGILDDLDKITAISALNSMEGGKLLVENLLIDVVSSVSTLCAKHSELTMQEFVTLSVDMKTKINLAKVLTNAEKNKKYLNELLEQALLDE